MNRRDFLRIAASGAATVVFGTMRSAGGQSGGGPGGVDHILPTVSSDRMLIKTSFTAAQSQPPVLLVDGMPVSGQPTDTQGFFWAFDAEGLEPGRRYTLDLRSDGSSLIDPWELSTFPAPDACPERLRLLVYTCAGGHDIFGLYHSISIRQRLLQRGLSFHPDAVIANGDHVYWDLRAGLNALLTGASPIGEAHAGVFDRSAPVLGHPNEDVLKRAIGDQIAGLYGTMLRGLPVFFLRDDHDYFEDDQVTPTLTSFPADDFMVALARASQHLYYPEFLPDPNRPPDLTGSAAPDRPRGVSEAFGTLRYGKLFEGLLYDCKGFMTPRRRTGVLIPREVEQWLVARMADPCPSYVVNIPSNPPGWTAGKFAEWYPDVVLGGGVLTTEVDKPGWRKGWLEQHDRVLAAASAMSRIPLFFSGDIHSIAEGLITRSGDHDFQSNPLVSVITGTPGTLVGWPSLARRTLATPPAHLDVTSIVPVQEENGFHIVDFDPDTVTIQHFRWLRQTDPVETIDTLQPFHVSQYPRQGVV